VRYYSTELAPNLEKEEEVATVALSAEAQLIS